MADSIPQEVLDKADEFANYLVNDMWYTNSDKKEGFIAGYHLRDEEINKFEAYNQHLNRESMRGISELFKQQAAIQELQNKFDALNKSYDEIGFRASELERNLSSKITAIQELCGVLQKIYKLAEDKTMYRNKAISKLANEALQKHK